LAAAAGLFEAAAQTPLPPVRPTPPESPAAAPPPAASDTPAPAGPACLARLAAAGVRAEAAAPPAPTSAGCAVDDPVRLSALDLGGGRVATFPDRPLLACPFAETLAAFTRDLVAPLAVGHLGAPLASLATGPGYECRGRNRQAGARLSAHETGIAIDVASIGFGGGRWVVVGAPRDEAERRFLGAVRAAACGWFGTVLGPGSDAAHENHFHFDGIVRGQSGRGKLCE
jgi:hypothetical protein